MKQLFRHPGKKGMVNNMFDSHDIEKYRSVKAPESLKERVLADAARLPKKQARVIGRGAFTRTASALAACFMMVVALTVALRMLNADPSLTVDGVKLDRAGESVVCAVSPATYGRSMETPAGIPIGIDAKGTVTLTVEGGELWTDGGERCENPCEAEKESVLYWLPLGAHSRLTLTYHGKSVTYALEIGSDPADIRIVFEN